LLAAGLALAGKIRRICPEPRVAIVLPPGRGATVANLAVVLAGKIPVNLNFTAGRASVEAACRIAGLRTTLTAGAFQERLSGFPWTEKVLLLEKMLPALKPAVVWWRLLAGVLPARLLAGLARVPRTGDRSEAITLFTSGSSGEPKGVVLSHRNLLGNVQQFSHALRLNAGDSILSCLPVFHSFGSTVNLWYPILEGLRMVTFPSPLEIHKNAELIERYGVKLLCSTPTFLRGYLRKAEPAQLESLELVITGAERLPKDVADAFEARFGKAVMQGYGLTETSPVVSVNLPDAKGDGDGAAMGTETGGSSRAGSVGKLMAGLSAEIRDPETGAKLSLRSTGMLWLKGVNIFEGYLEDPERTGQVLEDGWLRTGDLARFDVDGFLFIEGRLSRFSKIGGEMVPHETVESAVCAALGISSEEKAVAVAGVPDPAKGEALVLLSTRPIELNHLRHALAEAGLPNLWIPRRAAHIDEIPHLASGKLDLRRLQEMALEHAADARVGASV
jgi:acyl-[acyl-carrier-protein]-phospholipid O-acyltransferase/long-chain-fatty-acid--[acyl-carrier-protein] ligase